MSQTNRLVFDVKDLRVLMRCPDCKIELSFNPQSNQRVPTGCKTCGTTWNMGDKKIERAWNAVRVLRNAIFVVANGQDNSDMFDIQMVVELSE